jgi:hypothetical protein
MKFILALLAAVASAVNLEQQIALKIKDYSRTER